MRLRLLILLMACLSCTGTARAREQTFKLGSMQVTAWSPDQPMPGKLPVLIFSHGLHGCDVQSSALTQAFAAAGYLVFAPNHRDASCNGGRTPWFEGTELMFLHPEQWTEATYRNRADDVRRLVAGLYDDERFRDRADWSRLGLVGHSLGGYTALGLAGAWPDWKLPGVRAVLALAPYSHPFTVQRTLGGLGMPVMYQCGENDFAITPIVAQAGGSYEQSPQPKYYVEFAAAGHLVWTNSDDTDRQAILAYSLAFLDHYVKGQAANALLTHPLPGAMPRSWATAMRSPRARQTRRAANPDRPARRIVESYAVSIRGVMPCALPARCNFCSARRCCRWPPRHSPPPRRIPIPGLIRQAWCGFS
jgi:predicted dienelactone hydrolase